MRYALNSVRAMPNTITSPMSNGCVRQICATMNARCKRERLVDPLPPALLSEVATSNRVACRAGDMPNTTPVPNAINAVKPTVTKSG